ncbi:hypothetical protein P3L10_024603 [Capsicum annuum]
MQYRKYVIFIVEEINEEFSYQILATTLYLDTIDDSKSIYLYINGPGGDVHHTTSHLLQSALKRVIGQETSQAGSMGAFDRLRFDFNFHRPLLDKELVEIEGLINQWIGDGMILETKVMSLTDAKGAGAIAMFGEKYGEQVGILTILC